MNRKGQAIEVSILVFLIIAILVGYVILMPPEERDKLLNEDEDDEDSSTESESGKVLLSVSPGIVKASKTEDMSYGIEPIKIFSKINKEVQTLANSLTVAKSLLHNNYKNIYFDVEDIENLNKLSVTFLIVESKGNIKIEINENEIFNGELTSNVLPLEIPKIYLNEKNNILKMTSNFPGNIFTSNYYSLQDVKLVREYLNVETVKTRIFNIDNTEEINSASLSYYINCNSDEEGRLNIYLNEKEIFGDEVFCEYLEKRELALDKDDLKTSNTLRFEIDKGDYNIDEIEVELSMKNKDYPSYSFEIDSDDYDDIASGEKEVYLSMDFGDDSSHKEATIYAQENSFKIDTYNNEYEKEISSYVDDGANIIKIQPSRTFDIQNLKIEIR